VGIIADKELVGRKDPLGGGAASRRAAVHWISTSTHIIYSEQQLRLKLWFLCSRANVCLGNVLRLFL